MGVDRYWESQSECPAQLAAAQARIADMERELAELRAAKRADEERIRAVVEREAAAVLGPNGPVVRSWDVLARTIASRVASQLAGSIGVSRSEPDWIEPDDADDPADAPSPKLVAAIRAAIADDDLTSGQLRAELRRIVGEK